MTRDVIGRRMTKSRANAGRTTPDLRAELVAIAHGMHSSGLSPGKSGNFSVRVDGGMLITPTGIAYQDMKASDIVDMRMDGTVAPGQRIASSEWRIHLAIYRARTDAGAVVHVHSLNATALACLRRGIPAFHYMVAEFGGDRVSCAPYATYGSEELSRHALKALADRDACLLANHGSITIGDTLGQAFERAVSLEALASQYARALQIGRPKLLGAREMKHVIEKFKTYGRQTEVNVAT